MVAMPVANLPRLAVAGAGVALVAIGGVVVARDPATVWTGLIVLGLAALACAAWWSRAAALLGPGRGPRLGVVLACAAILGLYTANTDMAGDYAHARGDGAYRPVLARGDGHMMYLMARSTALDLDWVFDNDLARFGDPWNQPRTPTGRKAIAHPLGPALAWTPLIWLAQGGAVIANVFGADIPLHGYTLWHQRIVFLSSALFACGAALLGRRVAARVLGTGRRAWAPSYGAVAILLGTPLTYYGTMMPSYAHALDAFACAGFLAYWALTIGRRDARRFVILGALLGAATLARVQELALGVVVALEVVVRAGAALRARTPREALAWALGGALALAVTLVVFSPQLLEWARVYGKVTELPQGARYTRLEAPMIAEVLWAPRNGWFTTTPIAYAGVIGLACLPRRARLVGAGLIAAVAIQVYLNSTILDWWGGAAFGQRRLCNVTLPLVVGFAALLWRLGRAVSRARVPRATWHVVATLVFAPMVAWNLAAVVRHAHGLAAPSELEATCCDQVPAPLRGIARAIYGAIGNPFELPASAVFALRHDVSPRRWDQTVGNYPFVPALDSLLDDRLYAQHGAWRVGDGGIAPYLVEGFGPAQTRGGRRYRTTTGRATLLVPNLMPYDQRVVVWVAGAAATLRWNGEVVATAPASQTWHAATFELHRPALHTNELTIDEAGVDVADLDFTFLHP